MRIDIDFCYFLAYPASVKILVTVAAQWIQSFSRILRLMLIVVTILPSPETARPVFSNRWAPFSQKQNALKFITQS